MSERHERISLRFRAPETERYFVKSQSEHLLRNGFVLSVVAFVCTVAILPILFRAQGATEEDHRFTRAKHLAIGADLACVVLSLMMGIATKSPSAQKWARYEVKEVVAVLALMWFTVAPFLVSIFYGPAILGYSPQEIWGSEQRHSDTRMILVLSALTTASHLTLPIRWVVLFPFEVFTIIVYAVFAFIIGGPDGMGAWSTLALYAGLVLSSAIGRRTIENHQRDALAQLIRERQLRAETEFRLTQLEQKGPQSAPAHSTEEDQRTNARESWPETTPSANAFVGAATDGDFQSVIEVGQREQWLIDPKEVDLNGSHVLGMGAFGKVVTGLYSGSPSAVKLMPEVSSRLRARKDKALLTSFLHEIRVMRRLRHPCIVAFYGACFDLHAGTASLVLEWVQGPRLEQFILQCGVPDHPIVAFDQLKAMLDTCWAVYYLHTRQPSIVHGDLKGTNIIMERDPLRSDSFRAKLLDFGLSRVLTRHVGRMSGTTMWIAPEVLRGEHAHLSADTFSFGRLSFFILTGVFPFSRSLTRRQMVQILESGSLPALAWPRATSKIAEESRWWVEACSDCEPSRRPSMEDMAKVLMGMLKEPVAELVLDILQEGLPIKECSHEFTLQFGHVSTESHFAGLVENINEYESWLQTSINQVQYQREPPNLRVTLNMPQGPVMAACKVAPWSCTQEEYGATFDMTNVRIQFAKVGHLSL